MSTLALKETTSCQGQTVNWFSQEPAPISAETQDSRVQKAALPVVQAASAAANSPAKTNAETLCGFIGMGLWGVSIYLGVQTFLLSALITCLVGSVFLSESNPYN